MLPDPMIETHGLARSFKTKTGPVAAVQGIDFEVRPGQIVGLLGPNGAGKTTTLRMLTTLLRPTTGSATVAGVDLRADPREVRRRIGYVAQIGATPAPGTILGEELVAQARLQGMSKADATSRLAELLPRLDLAGFERRALSEMSGGQRRRFDVALGLMHSPMLVFLDEPTTGLDPQSRANLWDHIRSLRNRGTWLQGMSTSGISKFLRSGPVTSSRAHVSAEPSSVFTRHVPSRFTEALSDVPRQCLC